MFRIIDADIDTINVIQHNGTLQLTQHSVSIFTRPESVYMSIQLF